MSSNRLVICSLFMFLIISAQSEALEAELPDHIIQIGAQDNELIKIGVLDVTLYDGWNGNPVDPTGVQDSTVALQKAINDSRDHQLVAFFPNQENGERAVYLVSDTLYCEQEYHAIFRGEPEPNVLVGSTKGAGRPIIKLNENTNKFSDPQNPQFVILYWAHAGHWDPRYGYNWPECGENDISFNQIFRGIDIDLSGNPGAIGIQHSSAQGSAIEDTRIDATGAFAGVGMFGSLGGASYNVEVEGGKYGFYGEPYNCTEPCFSEGEYYYGYNGHGYIFGSTFKNQDDAAFYLGSRTASPVLVAGFHIVTTTGNITSGAVRRARGGFSLVDGLIETNGGQIFEDGKNLYMRDVYVKGADSVANGWDITDSQGWTHIKEYVYINYKETNLIDGVLNTNEYRSKTENVDVTTSQLIDSLVKKHRWDENTFPSFEDADAVNVKEMGSYSAMGDGVTDDTSALNYAIENYDKILLPRGIYTVSDTIVLKSRTEMVGVGDIFSRIIPHSSWTPSGETIILTTENDKDATTIISSLSVNTDMHLEVPGGPGFTPIEWRAGRNSVTRNVMAGAYGSEVDAFLGYHRFRISDNGGGSHYGLLARQRGLGDVSRALLIENTNEPICVYAFNGAGEPTDTTIEIKNSNNVNLYYSIYEGSRTCVKIENSENVSVFTSNKNGVLYSDRGGIEVVESDNVLVSNVCFPYTEEPNQYALRETYGGITYNIGNDNNIALFKRGDPGYTPILCSEPVCSQNSDCGSDPCKTYTCSNPGTCSSACSSQDKTSCTNDDGCCPSGCNEGNDNDCLPLGGPVAFWHFDEGSGDLASDGSGNANHGTIQGAAWTTGLSGSALLFDGINDYIDAGSGTTLDITDAVTMSAWVYPKILSGTRKVVDKNWDRYGMEIAGDAFRVQYRNDSNDVNTIDTYYDFPSANQWYFLTAVIDSVNKNVSYYVNGECAGDCSREFIGNSIHSTTGSLYVGTTAAANNFFNGTIDEVRIYDRALTPGEIMNNYNELAGHVRADINNDGVVDVEDLGMVATDFGKTSGFDPDSDTNSDGEVDIFDVVFVASRFT